MLTQEKSIYHSDIIYNNHFTYKKRMSNKTCEVSDKWFQCKMFNSEFQILYNVVIQITRVLHTVSNNQ